MEIAQIPDASDEVLLDELAEAGGGLASCQSAPDIGFGLRFVAMNHMSERIEAIKQELLRRLNK